MPIDHTGINVPKEKFKEVVEWYLAALAPLRYEKIMEFGEGAVGIGADGDPDFWIVADDKAKAAPSIHVGFKANDHTIVDAFHEAAVKAGGKDNGKPGIRSQYHPNYYGAFVFDPAGNNIEVVDHCPHPEK